jgi:nicotinamidase/pyrazinamidase
MPLKEHFVQPGPALSLKAGDALLVVDVQADFLAGGSLAVFRGDEVVPVLNDYLALFRLAGLPVLATRDWHPGKHLSFQAQGGPWPPHCVAGTSGARFAPGLKLPADAVVISKATEPQREAYSGFEGTELDRVLRQAGVGRLFIGGLATDYCVLNTVLDALALGYQTLLLQDAIRAVEVQSGDGQRALAQMLQQGAQAVTLQQIRVAS